MLWGNPMQEIVAKRLGVRREYVSRILNGLEPSEQLKRAIDAMLVHARAKVEGEGMDPPISDLLATPVGMEVREPAADEKRRQLRAFLERVISEAGEDLDRLGWIAVQLNEHLQLPASWRVKGQAPGAAAREEVNHQLYDSLRREGEQVRHKEGEGHKAG